MPEQPAHEPVIEVARTDVEQFLSKFSVRVTDGDSTSSHVVTLSGADWDRLGSGYRSPEVFVQACFTFLLQHEAKEQILASFDEICRQTRAAMDKSDAEYQSPWTLQRGAQQVFSVPRVAAFRSFVLHHVIHHRGQLSLYLRLNDIPVPAIYGPSADEGGA